MLIHFCSQKLLEKNALENMEQNTKNIMDWFEVCCYFLLLLPFFFLIISYSFGYLVYSLAYFNQYSYICILLLLNSFHI